MRCAQFQRQIKNSSDLAATAPIKFTKSDRQASTLHLQHPPSDNLSSLSLSSPAVDQSIPPSSTTSCKSTPTSSMIRRSQRECAKIQSQSTATMSTTLPPTNFSSSPISEVAATAQLPQGKLPRGGSNGTSSSSSSASSSVATLKSQHLGGAGPKSSSSVPQQSNHPETGKPGGGRHPHPPSATNTKLKHKCPFEGCPWRFATPYKLRRHIKSHTKETPYLCKECGRGFSVRYNLLMHIQTIHSQPQKYKCPIRGCKEAFHSQSRLNGHLRRIHKKDWKSLQNAKDGEVKGNRNTTQDSELTSDPSARKIRLPSTMYSCPHCQEEFTSKVKLSSHVKIHAPDKPFKCIIQGCNRCFDSQDKLSRHVDSHKNSKQFCCPHMNCNRIFLRQTHLRNHLKIHTQDHQFICPVLDCSQKFASESAYNIHLNSHINYGYSCPHPGCELSFLSRKRLAIHAQVVHHMLTNETGMSSPLLDGIQPHLGMSSLPSSSQSLMSMHPYHTPRRCVLDKEFIKNVDLPGLSAEDIEAVLSENEDWSGEQIDQFLHSAVDLSEIESKLFSLASYESDSGYSTYDVSPITSTAPANLNYSVSQVTTIPPPPLTLINHSTSPLFGNPAFTGLPMHPHPSPSPLIHDSAVSPCGSDGGFFSPHSNFGSLASTPSQETIPFFPPPPPLPGPPPPTQQVSMYSQQPYSHTQDYTNSAFSITTCFPDISSSEANIPNFSLQIPDIILHDMNSHTLSSCPIPPLTSDVKFSSYSHQPTSTHDPMVESPCMMGSDTTEVVSSSVKTEQCMTGMCGCSEDMKPPLDILCSGPPISIASPPALNSQVGQSRTIPELISSPQAGAEGGKGEQYPPGVTQYRYSRDTMSSIKKGKGGVSKAGKALKGAQKKKTQWPRSMNRANLIAFREHILNKLKKAQEAGNSSSGQVIPIQILANKATSVMGADVSTSTSVTTPTPSPTKFKAPSPNSSAFEVQVKYERNHVTPPKRCHSEPADLQSTVSTSSISLQNSHSDSNINGMKLTSLSCTEEMKLLAVGNECGDILSEFNFNSDTFLAPNVDRRMLNDLELKFSMENADDEAGEILDMFDSEGRYASTSSLSDVESMDMDCIHNLLDTSKPPQTFSNSPSPLGSPPPLQSSSESGNQTPLVSVSTPTSLSRSNSLCSVVDSTNGRSQLSSSCDSPGDKDDGVTTTSSFKFPEILSIQGSMVLDGVDVLNGEGAESSGEYQSQHAFLQSHHDPLLADSHSSHPTSVELFEF